jgi:hypothetical protein
VALADGDAGLEVGGKIDVVVNVERTPAAEEVVLEVGGGGVLTILLAEDGALMRLTVGLILPDGGACAAEFASVELDAIPGGLEGGTTRELLLMDTNIGVVDVAVFAVMSVGPTDDIGVVKVVAELFVE